MTVFGQAIRDNITHRYSGDVVLSCKRASKKIRRFLHVYGGYVAGFSVLMGLEIGIFFYFFLFSGKTLLPAFLLACFFLTLFTFLVIRLYLLSKKPEFYEAVCSNYLEEVMSFSQGRGAVMELFSVAIAASELASSLNYAEYEVFSSFDRFFPRSFMQKVSCFCFWRDYFRIREILLEKAVEAHLKVVQINPLDGSAHVALADSYVALSALYADPRRYPESDYTMDRDEIGVTSLWIPPGRDHHEMEKKFFSAIRRAFEEFKFLKECDPANIWVHSQLAYCYHDLQMPQEEIQEYEIILQLDPGNTSIMMKLGVLYFRQGMNVAGLKIYEELKKIHYKESQKLIKFYGLESCC